MRIRRWSVVLALFVGAGVHAQEICDNAIDDDADGLIDLNDTTDCFCDATVGVGGGQVSSIIPNPSFEEFTCCPNSYSQLNCAVDWVQATTATSDFFHQCDYFPNWIPDPPDGLGCVGGYATQGYKEYVGACLTEPMVAGESYTINMSIMGVLADNFSLQTIIPIDFGEMDVTIYGWPTCPSFPLPFYECPSDWIVLGSTPYQADGDWDPLTITFTPGQDIEAIMIGAPCTLPASFGVQGDDQYYPYFLYDGLTLNQTALFSSVDVSGNTCTNDIVLTGHPDSLATSYQWYQDGVAIIGQTDSVLQVSANGLPVGTYQFLASVADTACVIAQVIIADPLPVDPVISATPTIGCPPLDVQFTDATPGEVVSCAWVFGDGGTSTDCDPAHVYTEPGTYDVTLTVTMANGCTYDTTYAQYISVVPPPTAAFSASPQPANPDFTTIQFTDNSSADVTGWTWDFDTIPPFASSISEPVVTFPSEPGAYPVQLVVENAAGCTDTVIAYILVVPNGDLDMPNVFSPDGDGVNDRFVPLDEYPGRGRLSIYNRWGQEIFSTTSITVGWNGAGVPDGTYYWIVEALDTRTDIKYRTGHVTLLRGR